MVHANPRRGAWRLAALVVLALSGAVQAQELSIGLSGNITSMDPHFHNLSPNSNVAAHVYDRLVHHDENQRIVAHAWKVDPYSSAVAFPDWKEREASPILYRPPANYRALVTWRPRTWLLREGWKRHGLISIYEVPGPVVTPRVKSRKR